MQIVVDLRDNLPPIAVSFNDSWPSLKGEPTSELLFPQNEYTHHTPEHTAFNYVMDVACVRDGWNDVSVYNASHERHSPTERRTNSITIRSIELAIR